MKTKNGFWVGAIESKTLVAETGGSFPTRLIGLRPGDKMPAGSGRGSMFGFMQEGELEFELPKAIGGFRTRIGAQMYFSVPVGTKLESHGTGIVIVNDYHSCLPCWGGPLEGKGRLKYIDGCSDSLLVCPVMIGDPCFNLLVFPPGTVQSAHTHPSFRMGMVVGGSGECVLADGNVPLLPGKVFKIEAETLHSFTSGRDGLTVVAYHPDSDWGPTHEVHPMINRTILKAG